MVVTNYLWDVDSYLEEYDEAGIATATYTNEPTVYSRDEPTVYGRIISQKRDSTTNFYHYDVLGSLHQLTDQDENVTDTFSYDAWGNEVVRTGTALIPFRYIGEFGYYYDEELDSFYVRSRTYQPKTGRWISADPIGFVEGLNLYLAYFVPNNIDPSGLWTHNNPPRGNVYKSDKRNESLQSLAQIITGDPKDSVCIWPIADADLWENYPNAKCGALANVSNLTFKAKNNENVLMRQGYRDPDNDGFMNAVKVIWGRAAKVWASGQDASEYLANKSGQGKKPISVLLIGGHNYEPTKAEIGNRPPLPSPYVWTADNIIAVAKEKNNSQNSYKNAVQKIGPPRCWFAREAKVYGFACNTHPVWTSDWAKKIVRPSATVYGAIPLVFAREDTIGNVTTSYTQFAGSMRKNYTFRRTMSDPNWKTVAGSAGVLP